LLMVMTTIALLMSILLIPGKQELKIIREKHEQEKRDVYNPFDAIANKHLKVVETKTYTISGITYTEKKVSLP